jgi:hypothetical protein
MPARAGPLARQEDERGDDHGDDAQEHGARRDRVQGDGAPGPSRRGADQEQDDAAHERDRPDPVVDVQRRDGQHPGEQQREQQVGRQEWLDQGDVPGGGAQQLARDHRCDAGQPHRLADQVAQQPERHVRVRHRAGRPLLQHEPETEEHGCAEAEARDGRPPTHCRPVMSARRAPRAGRPRAPARWRAR